LAGDDLMYRPPEAGYSWLGHLAPMACLCIGMPPESEVPVLRRIAADLRAAADVEGLHRGTYAIRIRGDWRVLAVFAGREPRGKDQGRSRSLAEGHLITALHALAAKWDQAGPVIDRPAFEPGDLVKPKGGTEPGQIREVLQSAQGYWYRVDIGGGLRRYREQSLVRVDGDPRDVRFWFAQPPVGARDLALTLTWTKLRHPLTDTLYSYASSKTVFRPYQFKPVLKLLTASTGRLLIADEVGLGKTIEAGLIWNELEQRIPLDRVLVVAPAVLTRKWQAELDRRFDRRLDILRPSDLVERLADHRRSEPVRGIVSLESLRRARGSLEQLAGVHPRLDLVVVDEAHYLRNRRTSSYALGRLLGDWADYLIFLSATPLNLGRQDLFNLMSLLDDGQFGDPQVFEDQLEPNRILNEIARELASSGRGTPRELMERLDVLDDMIFGKAITARSEFGALRTLLNNDRPLRDEEVARSRRLLADLNALGGVFTRTRKAEVPEDKAVREPVKLDVAWTEQEYRFYRSIRTWYLQRALATGKPGGLTLQMPLRQAASCIPAAQDVLRTRGWAGFAEVGADLDDVFEQGDDDADDSETLVAPPDIEALLVPLSVDTKYERLLAELLALQKHGLNQAMIFSFFRGSLDYLANQLGKHFEVRVMHGGVPMAKRQQIMADFRAGQFDLLLLSEVGSEGLDFEFCNIFVNYDLPWNPMRVEQRIGRLDRFGQKHNKIFIYNMVVPGTIETDIFQRLYDRIELFRHSIGELEPILRDELADINRRILDPHLTDEQRQQQVERIAVALEQRTQDAAALDESRAILAGLDTLLVDGLSDAGPRHGRFVGVTEIHTMLFELFRRLGGKMSPPDDRGIVVITGTDALANQMLRRRVPDVGSRHSRTEMVDLLRFGDSILATFQPDVASRRDVDLLSVRHPLVKLALAELGDGPLSLQRFGTVAVPGLPSDRRYLISVDLAQTSGLRPMLEVWATAVDIASRTVHSGIGEALLIALAEGTLRDGSHAVPDDLIELWGIAEEASMERQQEVEFQRARDNAALVEARIQAQVQSVDLQIARTEAIFEEVTDPGIRRLHEGHLRNLHRRRAEIRADLEPRKELSVDLRPVAVVLAEPLQGLLNG
jgi:superfamily II DNA or RNA helicase